IRRRTSSGERMGSRPKATRLPWSGVRKPSRVLRRGVVPARVGPRRPVGPAGKAPETPARAGTRPYETARSRNSTRGAVTSGMDESLPALVQLILAETAEKRALHAELLPRECLRGAASTPEGPPGSEGDLQDSARGVHDEARSAGPPPDTL